MPKSKSSLDDLIEQAKENAVEDRDKTLDAYHKLKGALSADTEDETRIAMLLGPTVISLLEQLTRSNEQIVRLAQILERRESRKKEEQRPLIDLDNLQEEEVEDDFQNRIKAKMRITNEG